ncbi:MAG TPA: ATP-dependent DNA ligase, partial [Solirubrobacteraceae bacterium]|nr:ATP-dependent DNA ligase [Solirubrobacteraceae bacterium]
MPVSLPLKSPIQPQLARSKPELPVGDQWAYEPKYDGFRAIAFVDGDEWTIQSRSGRPLLRYFPELKFPPGRYILDGEIVIDSDDGHEDFDALQNRLHPAESRVQMLAEKTPARYVAFDILALDDDALLDKPFEERRRVLELAVGDGVDVTPLTREPDDAEPWLQGGEGVVAK